MSAALDLLDPLRSAAIRGDLAAVHDLLNRLTEADPQGLERRIVDESIAQSLAVLDGRAQPSTLRGAARQIACFVAVGLAYYSWLRMPW